MIALSVIVAVGVMFAHAKNAAPATQAKTPDAEYAGSAACAQCHKDIYKTFSKTSIGRSMSLVTPALLKTIHAPASVQDKNSNAHIEVEVRDGKLYQTEYEKGADGQEIYRDSYELEWIIGAGENGFGGLLKRDDYLFQAPLSFYSKTQSWALSPGYEFSNYGFNRPILPACIFCHSGRPGAIPREMAVLKALHSPSSRSVAKIVTGRDSRMCWQCRSAERASRDTIRTLSILRISQTPWLTTFACRAIRPETCAY